VYLADLRRDGRHDTAREAEGRFETVILADPVADVNLEEASQRRSLRCLGAARTLRVRRAGNVQVTAQAGLIAVSTQFYRGPHCGDRARYVEVVTAIWKPE
jgi:hypothetical protein